MSQSKPEQPSSKPAQPSTVPCAGGCGFYGTKEQKDCCSVCFKKLYPELAEQLAKPSPPPQAASSSSSPAQGDTESKEQAATCPVVADDAPSDKNKKKKVQKKKNRCWTCRKKMTLAGQFECKCGYVFCAMHRFPDAHECDFDHKQQFKNKLAKDNATVAPPKLKDKI